ncbi:MAG: metal-dependent transcriptional regulator [Anaerofustis sp.]
MNIYESGENYLETILILEKRNGAVRSIDIANELGFSKPSVSRAMSLFRSDGLITVTEEGHIHLTDKGMQIAREVYERHNTISDFLVSALKVDRKTADQDACRIEHVISEETFEKMKHYLYQAKKN